MLFFSSRMFVYILPHNSGIPEDQLSCKRSPDIWPCVSIKSKSGQIQHCSKIGRGQPRVNIFYINDIFFVVRSIFISPNEHQKLYFHEWFCQERKARAKGPSSDSAQSEFTCSICNRKFRAKIGLYSHQRTYKHT